MPSDFITGQSEPKPADRGRILAVVLVYAMFAAGWILLSDKLVRIIFSDPDQIILASILKGWLFVGITSLLLYWLLRRRVGAESENNIIGLFGISHDITERKRAEQALRESENRFRVLVEQSLAGIFIIQDNRFRYINPAFVAILGYDAPEALIDRVPVTDLISPEDREDVAENIRRIIEGEISGIMHYIFAALRQDGGRIDVEAHGSRIDYQGRPAIIGLILDICARKAAEEALRRQSEELAQYNSELERFNRATVGRELDMIALKQQVNELSRQLGQEPRYPLTFLESSPEQTKQGDSQ